MTRPAPAPAPTSTGHRTLGAPGIGVMVVGAVLLLLSFTTLAWYGGSDGADTAGSAGFTDLQTLTRGFAAPGAAVAYFGWLAWVLLIALIVVGFVANLPTAAANGLRVLGLFLGLSGSAVTYYSLSALHDALRAHGASGGVFANAQAGLWCALAGFLLAGIGAAIGPMRAT